MNKHNRSFFKHDIIKYNEAFFICKTDVTINLPSKLNNDWRKLSDEQFKYIMNMYDKPLSTIGYQLNIKNNGKI